VKKILVLGFLVLVSATFNASAAVTGKGKESKIAVSTHVDKTAVWVGDRLRYTVRVLHDPEIEFVLDNLTKENVNLKPFVVRDISVRQSTFGANKKIMEITFLVTAYETGQAELRIPSFPLYFFTRVPGVQRSQETAAESIPVPLTKIGLRSTLTADNVRPRESKDFWQFSSQRWMFSLALGLAGMAFLGVRAANRFWAWSHKENPRRRRIPRRARHRMLQDFIRKAQSNGTESAEEQVQFYKELSRFLREYLGELLETDAGSLTPDEIETFLKERGRDGLSAPVKTILERCEQVLYTQRGFESARNWREEVHRELGRLADRTRH